MKAQIRTRVLQLRDSIPQQERKTREKIIMETIQGLSVFQKASVVFFYASFRSEVGTILFIDQTLKMGKRVVLPVVIKSQLRLALYEITSVSELFPGYMKIPEPARNGKAEFELDHVDLIIIPGAAYDKKGNRIGYGGGYYDRLLSDYKSARTPVVAPAFTKQLVHENIPAEAHDKKVDIIVTENGVIYCHE
ncbi:MAG TPA: 5-formyltetrahydrofolate cyclo-ligase [Thermodesulfovibrionia bacterium]|nr:5-formyltetrahydrofolate cyclo-ligase [Thermodesulfovibrionia bacterium]